LRCAGRIEKWAGRDLNQSCAEDIPRNPFFSMLFNWRAHIKLVEKELIFRIPDAVHADYGEEKI